MASIQSTIQLVDRITSPVNNMISALNNLCGAYEDVDNEMQGGFDRSRIDSARAAIAQAVQQVDALGRSLHGIEAPEVPLEWQSFDGLEVFTNTGAERFQQEITSVNAMLDRLRAEQDEISQRANEMEILDPRAQYDIESVENRLHSLRQMIEQAADNAVSIGVDGADNANMERLRAQLTQTLSLQEQLNSAMQSGDLSGINNAYLQMSQNISSLERSVRDSFSQPIEVPIVWNSGDNVEVFSGADRYAQEIADVTARMQRLSDTQNQIAQNAANSNVFSPAAVSDMTAINQRISAIQARITQINSNRANALNPHAAVEAENLRRQLASMLQTQEQLNSAVDNMDVEAANRAYLQLSSSVNNTERYIRDNVSEQERFNHSVRSGASSADELLKKIGGFVGAFASVATVKKAIDLSDELVSTTARIDLMNQAFNKTNNTAIETSSLVDAVYQSAQSARGSFSNMAAVVAKFGNNAKDAFSSQQEVIDFATLVQKQMTIAGASTTEASNAMLQLSQALGSGTLRGDELNSIFEQAPNLIQSIAEYLNKPIGSIREMASEGEITADIVKNAIFAASDSINTQFEEMPMTWGQVWTSMQNTALMKFQPVLNKINDLANSERFQTATNGVLNGLAIISTMLLSIMDLVGAVAIFFQDNWSVIEPIIMGIVAALAAYLIVAGIVNTINAVMSAIEGAKAAAQLMAAGATFAETAAQKGLNAALMACPITWIILAIIALIAIIYAVCQAIAKATGVANSGFGVICGGVMVVIAFFKNLGLAIANIALGIWNALQACGENIYVVFYNCIKGVQAFWYSLLSTVMTVVAGICAALNKIPFISFDYSGIEDKAQEYAQKAADAKKSKLDFTDVGAAFDKGMGTFETFQDGWVSEAFNSGAAWGDGVVDGINSAVEDIGNLVNGDVSNLGAGYTQNQIASNVSDIAGNTARTADALDISGEDLKYLRDIAERDTVNRFTTAEVKIEWNNTQTINSDMDLDGVVDYFTTKLQDAIETTVEGVHA